MPTTPKITILLLVFILLGTPSYAQSLSITGQVIEQNSQSLTGKTKGFSNQTIIIDGKSVKTDSKGFFSLKLNEKNKIGYIHLPSSEYQIINQESLEQTWSCTQEEKVELQIEVGKSVSISANFSRFYQQLHILMSQTEIRWYKLFYADQKDTLAALLGDQMVGSRIDRGFLRELFQELEPQLEYWARRLAFINLDHHSADFKTAYQQLRAGQFKELDQAFDQLAAKKDIRQTAIKDLLASWYTAKGEFQKAAEILVKNLDQEQPSGSSLYEYYHLGMLTRSYDDIMGTDERLLNTACGEGNRFLALSQLTELYTDRLDFGKATTNFEAAELLWQKNIQKHSGRYEPAYARLLINMGVLLYQQSNTQKAKELVSKAIEIYEKWSQEAPELYEGELMRANAVLATFYVAYDNDYDQALRLLETTLLLGQRLSRQTPQLYLSEVADMYLWKGRCHQQLRQYQQATDAYELATRYYEQLALKKPMELESVCSGYFLQAEVYQQQLNQTDEPIFKDKGLEAAQKGLQKAAVWNRFDRIGSDMMVENLKYFEDLFKNWR